MSAPVTGNVELFKMIPIKAVEAIFGTKPKKAQSILHAAINGIVTKAVLHLVVPEKKWLRLGFSPTKQQQQQRDDMITFFQNGIAKVVKYFHKRGCNYCPGKEAALGIIVVSLPCTVYLWGALIAL